MKLIFFVLFTILLSSCFRNSENISVNGDLAKIRVGDSILAINTEQQIIQQRQIKDSIHIADSLAALPAPVNYDTVLFASILRTPCLGKCPHYEIRLFQSGLAEYIGYASVDKIGKFQCRIDSSYLNEILEMATQSGFFELNDFYPDRGMPINDFPMCVCSIKKEESLKIVYNRNDAPLNLIKFQNFLDKLFEDRQWLSLNSSDRNISDKALLPDRQ
jgi:hypothetical protein